MLGVYVVLSFKKFVDNAWTFHVVGYIVGGAGYHTSVVGVVSLCGVWCYVARLSTSFLPEELFVW